MSEQNVELVRRGYEALRSGDVDTVYELLDPDLDWRGWRSPTSDCQSRAEAMMMIKERLQERAVGELAEIVDVDREHIVVVMRRNRRGDAAESRVEPDLRRRRAARRP